MAHWYAFFDFTVTTDEGSRFASEAEICVTGEFDLDCNTHTAEVRCPECGDTVTVYGRLDSRCSCGYEWHLRAVGDRPTDESDPYYN